MQPIKGTTAKAVDRATNGGYGIAIIAEAGALGFSPRRLLKARRRIKKNNPETWDRWTGTRKELRRALIPGGRSGSLPVGRVGELRDLEDIAADPEASESEIYRLSQEEPIAALNHPNCPADIWWRLAAYYPIEAMNSPLFPLLAFAESERWTTLRDSQQGTWLYREIQRLRTGTFRNPKTGLYGKEENAGVVFVRSLLIKYMNHAIDKWKESGWYEKFKGQFALIEKAIKVFKSEPTRKTKSIEKLDNDLYRYTTMVLHYEDSKRVNIDRPDVGLDSILEAARTLISFYGAELDNVPAKLAFSVGNLFSFKEYAEWKTLQDSLLNAGNPSGSVYNDPEVLELHIQFTKTRNYYMRGEVDWQWNTYLQSMGWNQMYRSIFDQIEAGFANQFREQYYGPEAKREAKVQADIKKAIGQMQGNTAQIIQILNSPDANEWPTWLTVGLVGVGVVALVILAPAAISAAGPIIAQMGARAAAAEVATAVATYAARAEVQVAAIGVAKSVNIDQTIFLEELAAKLAEQGVEVVEEVVVAISR